MHEVLLTAPALGSAPHLPIGRTALSVGRKQESAVKPIQQPLGDFVRGMWHTSKLPPVKPKHRKNVTFSMVQDFQPYLILL